jgi:hypothetical protein
MNLVQLSIRSLLILSIALTVVACGGSSSSSSSGPTGTVRGNLASFSTFNDGTLPVTFESEPALFAFIDQLGLDTAHASVYERAGITVTVGGVTTTTNASGGFEATGVPAGQRIITFSGNGVSGSTTINVVSGGTVVLVDVVVERGRAQPATVRVTGGRPVDDDDSDDDSSDDDDSDDDSSDDDDSDDDSDDDDSDDDSDDD